MPKNNEERSEELEIEGQRIHVRVREHAGGAAPPLLICNGLGVNLEILDPLVNALPAHSIIRFDAPGVGASSTPLTPYRISWLAKILDRLLERLGVEQVDVLGISWGGGVAQELALDFPHRCRKVLLAATSMGVLSVPGNPISVMLAMSPLHWISSHLLGPDAGVVFGGDFRGRRVHRGNGTMPGFTPPNPLGFYWQVLAVSTWTSLHRLGSLRQPTLVLAGEDDPLVPLANARCMQTLIPDAKLVTFDCGHLFTLTRAPKVAAAIESFTQS